MARRGRPSLDGASLTVRVPEDQAQLLYDKANAERTSVAAIVRRALDRFFLTENPSDTPNRPAQYSELGR